MFCSTQFQPFGIPIKRGVCRDDTSGGFSLIELMIVVAITGVLVSVAMPNFIGILEDARLGKAMDDMHTIKQACIMYYTTESKFPIEISGLLGKYMAKIPNSPWGTEYRIDEFHVLVKSPGGEMSVPYFNPGIIAFLRDGDIYTRDFISGSSTAKLTDMRNIDSFAWDKGGTRIFFSSRNDMFSVTRGSMEADIEDCEKEFEGGRDPVISPDGIYMCYCRGSDLYIKTTNIKSPGTLFIQGASDVTWAPNSKYICYTSGNFLWVAKFGNGRVAGKAVKGYTGNTPRWSTLNQQIVFLRGSTLYATSARDITDGAIEEPVKIAEGVSFPSWVPRTQKVMYVDKAGGDMALMIDVRYPEKSPSLVFADTDAAICSPH